MKIKSIIVFLSAAFLIFMAASISGAEEYGWSENSGWVNIEPSGYGGMIIESDHLEGYIWSEGIGWIKLGTYSGGGSHAYNNTTADNWGVNRKNDNTLEGFAWSENSGWINFNPEGSQVKVDPGNSSIQGFAWSEGAGWIHFKNYIPEDPVIPDEPYIPYEPYIPQQPQNNPPVILSDNKPVSEITIDSSEDGFPKSFSLILTGNDPDGDNLTWLIPEHAVHGTAVINKQDDLVIINYNPDKDYNGKDTFKLELNDGEFSSFLTVNVNVLAVNDLPVIIFEENAVSRLDIEMDEDGDPHQFSLTLSAADIDGDVLKWSILKQPSYGTALIPETENLKKNISYMPETDYNGQDMFEIQVSDGIDAAILTLNINIRPVNDKTVITGISRKMIAVPENTALLLSLSDLNISDTDNDLNELALFVKQGEHYTLTGNTLTPDKDFTGWLKVPVYINDSTEDSEIYLLDVIVSNDADADGMADIWEAENGLDPLNNDAQDDNDRDGFTNLEEYLCSTLPFDLDSRPDFLFADAGAERSAIPGETVRLNAGNSISYRGYIAKYLWEQISGTEVTLSDINAVRPVFTVPETIEQQALEFQLTVTSPCSIIRTDTCIINIIKTGIPPTADAGEDQLVIPDTLENSIITLDGSRSSDPDSEIVEYTWNQVDGLPINLSDINSIMPTFTLPGNMQGRSESLAFNLTVTDDQGLKSSDTCIVNISESNMPPEVVITPFESPVAERSVVVLNASNSKDPDSEIVMYLWRQKSGVPVILFDSMTAALTFATPPVEHEITLVFELTIWDEAGLRGQSQVSVSIEDNEIVSSIPEPDYNDDGGSGGCFFNTIFFLKQGS
ncbi:REJ domain-containing protein [Desulfonema limicola]|uniref:REJ domain-containing protein n=1 Tax=Desulfonema limicola TaxID=45656 RepID=A0A975B727_9BACT|nr:Ig-like domain-containing protein [Desulfonema limicola]QTA80018.1 REJ domain-containing protein [Desulfonema limicola]